MLFLTVEKVHTLNRMNVLEKQLWDSNDPGEPGEGLPRQKIMTVEI